jgi:hypothetical protein
MRIEGDMQSEAAAIRTEKYLEFAVTQIDRIMGKGFAAANPGVLVAFVQARGAERIAEALNGLQRAVEDIQTHGIAAPAVRPLGKGPPYVPLSPPAVVPVSDPLGRWKG